ncbi:DUF1799 domain-containing protein [Variovorax paradoxus]|nr:DUF1799 domain-containing protein [Variovorax paradoxus]
MMQFFALTADDYPEDDVDVWPENWPAVLFFEALGNGSWNMGPNGPTGLRYETFRELRLVRGVRAADWPAMFEALRVLEQAALEEIHKE